MNEFFSIIRNLLFILIGALIINDLLNLQKINFFKKWLPTRKLTATSYLGVFILIVFILWPSIGEMNIGNFGIKKLEDKISNIENIIKDLYGRRETESWMYEKFKNFHVEKCKEKWFCYEIPLKYKPVINSVDLWLGSKSQNPKYYDVISNEKKIILRLDVDMDGFQNYMIGEPAITLRYIRESN